MKRVLIESNGAYSADWVKVYDVEVYPESNKEPERTLIHDDTWHSLDPRKLTEVLEALGIQVEYDDEVKFSAADNDD